MSGLNVIDDRSVHSHKSDVYVVHIKPSTIAHPKSGEDCIANQELTKRDVIGYYFGTLAYYFMVDALNAGGVHGECVIVVTRKQLHSLMIRTTKEVYSLFGMLQSV